MEMKKIARMFFVFAAAAALVMAFAGCGGDDNTQGGGGKPANIAVKDAAGTAVTSLTLEVGETKELTVSADGATDLYWGIKSGSADDVVELADEETATVSIKGKKIGSTKIVAYAENAKGNINTEITITVTEAEDPGDPDEEDTLIFEWSYAKNGWNNGTDTMNSGNQWIPAGQTISMRLFGGVAVAVPPDPDNKGIRLGGAAGASAAARLTIGQANNYATVATTTIANFTDGTVGGKLDLTKKVKLTIGYDDLVDASGRYNIRLYINNNGTGDGNGIFNNNLGNWGTGITGLAHTWPSNKLIEYTFDPNGNTPTGSGGINTNFSTHTAAATLEYAFICIHCQQGDTSNDNFITITSIKLEYVD
jgi:hypothetical protein